MTQERIIKVTYSWSYDVYVEADNIDDLQYFIDHEVVFPEPDLECAEITGMLTACSPTIVDDVQGFVFEGASIIATDIDGNHIASQTVGKRDSCT